ncbi:MAG: methylamine dehydrogenase accessory protein MauD [Proteobacteria bacterium]|nr:methylamine dehydrogenase accessory protein MauD [Pseudomonadota bacterium]
MNPLLLSNLVLWAVVIALCLVVLALLRQVGVLHERIAPVGALMLAKGLKIGELAPSVPVADLEGRSVSIGGERADGRTQLLMFVSPTCPVCKVLLPVLKSSRKSEQSWLDIVLASDGDFVEQSAFVREQGLEMFPYVLSAPLGISFQVSRLPYAVLIDEQGVLRARGLINSREHLESLFEAKRLGVASIQDYLEAGLSA